jgi:hypothetical protein
LLWTIPLVLAVEAFVARHEGPFLSPMSRSWQSAAAAAGAEAVGRDVLYFGDSQAKVGILPRVVEARTGLSGYNLAVLRGMPASSYGLLKRALDAGARPKAVVVNFNPELLNTAPRVNVSLWTRVLGPGDLLRLVARSRDPRLGARLAARLFPTFEIRPGVRDAFAAWAGIGSDRAGRHAAFDRAAWSAHHGAQPVPDNPAFVDLPAAPGAGTAARPWRCRPENAAYVRDFFRLAESRGITVVWVIPPISPGLLAQRVRNGQEAAYDRFVAEARAGHPGVTLLDARPLGLGSSEFFDIVHLSGRGAGALSGALALALAPRLASAPAGAGIARR